MFMCVTWWIWTCRPFWNIYLYILCGLSSNKVHCSSTVISFKILTSLCLNVLWLHNNLPFQIQNCHGFTATVIVVWSLLTKGPSMQMSLILSSSLLNTRSNNDGVSVPLPWVGCNVWCHQKESLIVSWNSYWVSHDSPEALKLCQFILRKIEITKN